MSRFELALSYSTIVLGFLAVALMFSALTAMNVTSQIQARTVASVGGAQ